MKKKKPAHQIELRDGLMKREEFPDWAFYVRFHLAEGQWVDVKVVDDKLDINSSYRMEIVPHVSNHITVQLAHDH